MLLAIDSGNTSIVFAVFGNGGDIVARWRTPTHPVLPGDEMKAALDDALGEAGLKEADITDAILATVVPDNLEALCDVCRDIFKVEPLVVGEAGVALGIEARVDNAAEVGADRLVNAVAAGAKYDLPLVIVDFGTATTFDVVDGDGNYCGGVIAPGINLSLEALHDAAAKLPRVDVARPDKVIGTSTVGAMRSGIFWGYVSLIEGVVARIGNEAGNKMNVVATGGLAHLFADATETIHTVDDDLTVKGLYIIHQLNRKQG